MGARVKAVEAMAGSDPGDPKGTHIDSFSETPRLSNNQEDIELTLALQMSMLEESERASILVRNCFLLSFILLPTFSTFGHLFSPPPTPTHPIPSKPLRRGDHKAAQRQPRRKRRLTILPGVAL